MILLPVAVLFIVYALRTYLSRSEKIKTRDAERYIFAIIGFIDIDGSYGMIQFFRWDDPFGPVLLTMLLIFALAAEFVLKVSPCCLRVMTISHKSFVAF